MNERQRPNRTISNAAVSANDNGANSQPTVSVAGSIGDLPHGAPDSFHDARNVRSEFTHVSDPMIGAQLKDMKLSEVQRRDKYARASGMVKQDKPRPELWNKTNDAPKRQSFNQAWVREQREARLAEFRSERKSAASRGRMHNEVEPHRTKSRTHRLER